MPGVLPGGGGGGSWSFDLTDTLGSTVVPHAAGGITNVGKCSQYGTFILMTDPLQD